MADLTHHYADTKAPICPLEIKAAWETLTPKEQRYAHSIARASWLGARITLHQTTPHASDLFDLLRLIFSNSGLNSAANDADYTSLQEYAAQVLCNLSNFRSFGDSKFIPRLSKESFRSFVTKAGSPALELYNKLEEDIYAVSPSTRTLLGYEEDGHVTGYYGGVSKDEIKAVQAYLESKGQDALNTRLFKVDGKYELRVASAKASRETIDVPNLGAVEVVHGDFAQQMKEIADELERAIPFAANEHQTKMLEAYVRHFRSGDIDEHKESQREWIQDLGPAVESNIGFVETYRDPAGVRAEWEVSLWVLT